MEGDGGESVNPTPEKVARSGGGRKAGAKGYKIVEIMKLLKVIEALAPMGPEGWKRVTIVYNKWAEETGVSDREMENLRKKYKSLTRYKPEPGVTQIPEEVKEARRIEKLILDRIGAKGGGAGRRSSSVNGSHLLVDDEDRDDPMKIDTDTDLDVSGRRGEGSAAYAKSMQSIESAVLTLTEKIDQQSKDLKELQSVVRSFLEAQQSTVNALVQQNQQFMMILVQGQKGSNLYTNPQTQTNPADGSGQ